MATDIQYNYTDFNIENHNITFSGNSENDVLISIPFAEDTPKCIKDKLNEIISQGMGEWLENSIIEGCIPVPKYLSLNARMQVQCLNDGHSEPKYYISIVITDKYSEIGMNVWIDKIYNIFDESPKFQNEFISYCRYQLDKLLFPVVT